MKNLFKNYDETAIEKFELIFDRAKTEKDALSNAIDYYFILQESGTEVDIDEIIDAASNFGYDFENFETLINNYDN
jgi:hypothetical protein